ncbi:hypothetical protein ACS0TY_029729 [Phlomoides rotata]
MLSESGTSRRREPRVKCHWKHDEDERLTLLVKTFGPEKWDRIASYIPGRTGKSCRIRWLNQLDPRINMAPFSADENQMLIELHREYGNRWSTIARYFHFRTDNHVKNQYHVLTGKRCVRSSVSSRITDPHAPLGEGSAGMSQCQSISMALIGSQFIETGTPSVYGQVETLAGIGSPILRRLGIDSSMVSDSSSDGVAEPCPVPQPQQGVGIKKRRFIDFLGIGSSVKMD